MQVDISMRILHNSIRHERSKQNITLVFFTSSHYQLCERVPVSYNRVMTDLSEQYALKAEKLAGEAQYAGSNFYLRKAIPIYKNSGNWIKMVECYIKLGNNYKDIDEHKKALENLDLALSLTLKHLGHKPLSLAKSYIKLAYKYFHQKKDSQIKI